MNCICIVCRKQLKNLDVEGYQPDAGLAFSTPGHYGSGVYDPMDGTHQ